MSESRFAAFSRFNLPAQFGDKEKERGRFRFAQLLDTALDVGKNRPGLMQRAQTEFGLTRITVTLCLVDQAEADIHIGLDEVDPDLIRELTSSWLRQDVAPVS